MKRAWDRLPFLSKGWEPLAEPAVRAASGGYLVEAAGGGTRCICSNLTAERPPDGPSGWTRPEAGGCALRGSGAHCCSLFDTGQPVSQRQGAGCSGGRVYLQGTACLYSAKFHTKTEVMGKTDMEEIICKVIRAIILIKIFKKRSYW